MSTSDPLPFEQLVFSGGGTRCFWHGGFLETVRGPLDLKPERVAGVSGGALAAACFIGGRDEKLLKVMGAAFDRRDHNVSTDWNEIGENGLTPHQQMYREVVRDTLDAEAIERIADGPAFEVLLAHPPYSGFPKLSTFPMMAAYLADTAIRSTPHVIFPEKLGAHQQLVDARKAARDGRIVDLICNAAVIPPVFNLQGWNGRKVIDGGMTSKAPMPTGNRGRTLVLLTRKFRNLPEHPDRVYVEPSQAVPADKIDFTDRGKIVATWNAGVADGRSFLRTVRSTAPLVAANSSPSPADPA
ncbi:patatin-like phospholipase family protein [Aurantimonas sp. 22II-16-19i]|uniref:patatin-like phospholipase family protein n=1 Tax=Aurantimonas sp. 22II-16-19i TaxID=1317114 RepID=UPI0009F7CCBF|nr:patatin-like phospholipase family protein [Aurantimonas sp. 22II-16-19i]ORE93918.1 phospholipase [Aurantimonas sp. 22II-16-19i]